MRSNTERKIIKIGKSLEDRGCLFFLDFEEAPFEPRRAFIVNEVPEGETRGSHAHLCCDQFLICTKGRLDIIIDDGFYKKNMFFYPEKALFKMQKSGAVRLIITMQSFLFCAHTSMMPPTTSERMKNLKK